MILCAYLLIVLVVNQKWISTYNHSLLYCIVSCCVHPFPNCGGVKLEIENQYLLYCMQELVAMKHQMCEPSALLPLTSYFKIISDQMIIYWLFLSDINRARAMKMVDVNAGFINWPETLTGMYFQPTTSNTPLTSQHKATLPLAARNYLLILGHDDRGCNPQLTTSHYL